MADHVMESRLWLARPRPDVFTFLADPANLARVMPPSFRVRLLTPGVRMEAGAVADFRIAWLGLPLRWRMFVREWDPPYRFVDVQVSGPYARWEHRHRLLEEGDGTWIEDRVTYRRDARAAGRPAAARGVGVPARAADRAARPGQRAGRLMPRRSSRGRTRSLSSPMRARFCTIEPCMSLRKYLRNGAKSLAAAVSRR